MNLTDEQKEQVKTWLAQGLKLSEIQNRLAADLGLRLTYLEVKLLVDDLKVVPKDPELPKAAPPSAATTLGQPAEPPKKTPGKVQVSVDSIAVPGALASGSVTFSDGQTAQWYFDEMGRLGLATKQKGYRPPPSDVQAFQAELEKHLHKMGF